MNINLPVRAPRQVRRPGLAGLALIGGLGVFGLAVPRQQLLAEDLKEKVRMI